MVRYPVATLLVLLLAGCGWDGEADVHGMHLVAETARFDGADLRLQIREAGTVAAGYWGGSPERLSGWRLIVKDGDVWCAGHGGHDGCTDPSNRTITVNTRDVPDFVHSTFLHEAGHVFLGDANHVDARWWDCQALHDLWVGWAGSYGHGVGYLGEWAGDGCRGACMGTCRYEPTAEGPVLLGCSWP